jgi:hypothetical protein
LLPPHQKLLVFDVTFNLHNLLLSSSAILYLFLPSPASLMGSDQSIPEEIDKERCMAIAGDDFAEEGKLL